MQAVYEAAGGAGFFLGLDKAWHARVMADEVVSQRLAAYWAEALGGPPGYSGSHGNGQHEDMDRRAIACFDEAPADVGLTVDHPVRKALAVTSPY